MNNKFMESLEEFSDLLTITEIGCLISFIVLDNILLLLIRSRKPLLENGYYKFHKRHGFIKIIFLKLIAVLYIIYFSVIEPAISAGRLSLIAVLAYGFCVITLLIDFLRK